MANIKISEFQELTDVTGNEYIPVVDSNGDNKKVKSDKYLYTLPVATTSKLGGVRNGADIVVGEDGSVTVKPMTVTRIHSMGISTAYKLFSINSMGDKGNIIFSIVSPVLGVGAGYATYMVYRGYQNPNRDKHCHPVCLYATESSMYNRVKLVRTGGSSFDVYYQSSIGNDYCCFILNCATSREISIVAAGVSSIPGEIYKESSYMSLHLGDIYGSLNGNADTATKASQDGNGNNIVNTYATKDIATTSKAGLMSAEDKQKLDSLTAVTANSAMLLPSTDTQNSNWGYDNSGDSINVDNYPQENYGNITIWLNGAMAQGTLPGQEGVIYQTKYKSQKGDKSNNYVDCLTQLYVGSGGIKQRTVIDYDTSNPFGGIPWS